jgi:nitrogen fixation protein NifB
MQVPAPLSPELAPLSGAADVLPGAAKPLRIAVASSNGMLVDLHFGHASFFFIYECSGDGVRLLE